MLEYSDWPLERQTTVYRGMVFVQTREEIILAIANSMKMVTQMLLSIETDQEQIDISSHFAKSAYHTNT